MICLESIVDNSAIVNRQSPPSELVGYRNKLGIENGNTFPCSMIVCPPRPSGLAYLSSELAG